MKWISLIAMFFVGCYSTSGLYDSNLTSTQPYVFEYTGDQGKAMKSVKALLYREGWGIDVDDEGFITTGTRRLDEDEFLSRIELFGSLTGKEVFQADGRLRFEFIDGLIFMTGDVFNQHERRIDLSQGYPLMMKYRRLLEEQGFRLAVPAGAKYSRVAD